MPVLHTVLIRLGSNGKGYSPSPNSPINLCHLCPSLRERGGVWSPLQREHPAREVAHLPLLMTLKTTIPDPLSVRQVYSSQNSAMYLSGRQQQQQQLPLGKISSYMGLHISLLCTWVALSLVLDSATRVLVHRRSIVSVRSDACVYPSLAPL